MLPLYLYQYGDLILLTQHTCLPVDDVIIINTYRNLRSICRRLEELNIQIQREQWVRIQPAYWELIVQHDTELELLDAGTVPVSSTRSTLGHRLVFTVHARRRDHRC